MGFSENPVQFDLTNIDIDCSLANPWITACLVLVMAAATVIIHRVLQGRQPANARILITIGAVLAVLLSPGLGKWLSVVPLRSQMAESVQLGCISISKSRPWHLIALWLGVFGMFEAAVLLRRRARLRGGLEVQ